MYKGTAKERGLTTWSESREFPIEKRNEMMKKLSVYDIPFGMEWIKSKAFMRKFPLSPTYKLPNIG